MDKKNQLGTFLFIALSGISYIALCTAAEWFFDRSDIIVVISLLYAGAFFYCINKEKARTLSAMRIFRINPEIFVITFFVYLCLMTVALDFFYPNEPGDHIICGFCAMVSGCLYSYILVNLVLLCKSEWKPFFYRSLYYRVYSKRRLDKSKRKYEAIISAMEEMAKGNLEVSLPEKLGKLEGLREPVAKIRDGLEEAVKSGVRSERMRVELITNVSHDLKTPLTAIITYIDLLKDDNLEPEKRKEYLNILDNRANRLKSLIEDLFEVSKATTGNVKFDPVEMDLVSLLKQVLFEYEDKLNDAGLEIVFENEGGGKKIIPADPQKTYRIYSNLIGNAAKYALHNSRLYIQVGESESEVIAVIRNVSANRIRITGSELAERFVRGDQSRNTEGSGLGLAIAKSFTQLQGGCFDIIVDGDLFKVITVWKKSGINI